VGIVTILLTAIALRRVIVTGRRYKDAENKLIVALNRLGKEEAYYSRLVQARHIAEEFVTGAKEDRRSLTDANEFVVGIANNELDDPAVVRIMVGILRHGSDRNKANYLAKLLDRVDLNPPSSRADEPNSPTPNQPGQPLGIAPSSVPARVRPWG
jgi:hypothetical protein